MSAFVEHADDGTQIAEQILPYFRPEFTTNINLIPDMNVTVDTPVIIQSMNVEDTYEGDYETRRALIYNFEFIVKGYMYGPVRTQGLITRAITNISDGIPPEEANLLTRITVTANDDIVTIPVLDEGFPTTDDTVTITTVAQNVWYTITGDTGSEAPSSSIDELTVIGGTGDVITTDISNSILTINHSLGSAGQILQANGTNNYWGPRARSQNIISSATITPPSDTVDQYNITALATNATLDNPSGTPTNGQKLMIRLLDDGTPRTLSYGANYRAIGITLPSVTVANKTLYYGCVYNSEDSLWDIVAFSQEV